MFDCIIGPLQRSVRLAARRWLASLVLGGAVLGCGEYPFTVAGASGQYTLVSIGSYDLPATFADWRAPCSITWLAGTLTLKEDQTYVASRTASDCDYYANRVTRVDTDDGTFELVEPSNIRFVSRDPASGWLPRLASINGEEVPSVLGDFMGDHITVEDWRFRRQ